MSNLPSAGKIGLAWKCLGSVLLPQAKDEAGPEAEEGKRKHAVLEEFFKSGRQEKPGDPADSELCERACATVGSADAEWPEFGLAVDPSGSTSVWSRSSPSDTGVVETTILSISGVERRDVLLVADGSSDGGGISVGSGSVDRANWFVAVADLIQWRGGSTFAVFDWKSSSWATDPQYNWQLLLPAIYLWLSLGRPDDFRCELGIIYIAKPTGDGAFERSAQYFVDASDCERLLRSLGKLRDSIRRSDAGRVTLYEGKHCDYCPARHRCPAKVGALEKAVEAAFIGIKPSDVGLVKVSRTLVDSAPQIKKMEINILKAHGGELDLEDGRVAVLTEKNGKYKVYTRKNVKETTTGSNAEKDDSS